MKTLEVLAMRLFLEIFSAIILALGVMFSTILAFFRGWIYMIPVFLIVVYVTWRIRRLRRVVGE